jgi:ribonuclease HI
VETIETDLLYSAVKKDLAGVIDVFVDGSYSAVTATTIEQLQPFGAGWSIVGRDGLFAGYGVRATWASYTTSSDLSELRAMLAFLDTVNTHHSRLISRENVFRIHSDSQNLIGLLQKNLMTDELTSSMADRYGSEYARIVDYRKKMTLSFHWVKGHAENEFNGTADLLARKCFRKLVASGEFSGDERRAYIHTILSLRNAHPTILPKIKPAEPEEYIASPASVSNGRNPSWAEAQNLLVSFKSEKLQFRTAYIVSTESGVLYDHVVHLDSLNATKEALQVKALVHALRKYFTSEYFDPALPLKIWSNAHIGGALMNSLSKGNEPKVDHNDLALKKNLDILQGLISGVKVRYVDDVEGKLSHLTAVSSIILESHLEKMKAKKA